MVVPLASWASEPAPLTTPETVFVPTSVMSKLAPLPFNTTFGRKNEPLPRLISSVAPRRLIGLTGGTFNFISNLSGIATPLVIGYLAQGGNFAPGLTYIATVSVMGARAYILMIGKLERVE